jgi:L-fuconolactonase
MAFGPSRLMWGGDFPPVAGREGYRNALHWTLEHLAFCSADDKA